MEQPKQILYDYQLLSLETGGRGFSTTTDVYVRSGQIRPYNQSMPKERIAEYISDYIMNNWNQKDIQKAVIDSQNAIPFLRRKCEEKQEQERIKKALYEYLLLIENVKSVKNERQGKHIDETFGFPMTSAIHTTRWPSGVLPIHRERWSELGKAPPKSTKEEISKEYANHIIRHWNQNDIQKAYKNANDNMPLLRKELLKTTNKSTYSKPSGLLEMMLSAEPNTRFTPQKVQEYRDKATREDAVVSEREEKEREEKRRERKRRERKRRERKRREEKEREEKEREEKEREEKEKRKERQINVQHGERSLEREGDTDLNQQDTDPLKTKFLIFEKMLKREEKKLKETKKILEKSKGGRKTQNKRRRTSKRI